MAGRLAEYSQVSCSSDEGTERSEADLLGRRKKAHGMMSQGKQKSDDGRSEDRQPGQAEPSGRDRDFERTKRTHRKPNEHNLSKKRPEKLQGRGRKDERRGSGDRRDADEGRYGHDDPVQDDSSFGARRRSRSRSNEYRRGDYGRNDRNRYQGGGNHDRRDLDRRGDNDRRYEDSRRRLTSDVLAKLPAYVNPSRVNVNQVIQQQEKRKLLWSGTKVKKDEAPAVDKNVALWNGVSFAGDSDGAVASKFKKLMGLKADSAAPSQPDPSAPGVSELSASGESEDSTAASISGQVPNVSAQQDELFRNLDRQYQMARLSAHTQRGVGLGFNSR